MSVAGSCDTYKGCVFHSHRTTGFVNVDLCLGIFLFSLSFQFRMQLLHCLHLQYTTVVMCVIKIECFIPKHRVSWTKSG